MNNQNALVRQAIETYFTDNKTERKPHKELWVSDLGMHPYRAMNRLLNGVTDPLDIPTLEKMQCGSVFEDATLEALRFAYPGALTQFPLYNNIWSGYADAVLWHGLPSTQPVIIEHKGTSAEWWDYKESLPRSTHVCQLWLYGQLYEEMYGIKPRLILYYRSWKYFAEFEIKEARVGIAAAGIISNKTTVKGNYPPEEVDRLLAINPASLRYELEHYFQLGELPQDDDGNNMPWDYPERAFQIDEEIPF
jgi:hypothetical protein